MLNDSADSNGGCKKCMKNVIFLWSAVVAAHLRNSLSRALQNNLSYWLLNTHRYTQTSDMSIISYDSRQTVKKTISD